MIGTPESTLHGLPFSLARSLARSSWEEQDSTVRPSVPLTSQSDVMHLNTEREREREKDLPGDRLSTKAAGSNSGLATDWLEKREGKGRGERKKEILELRERH